VIVDVDGFGEPGELCASEAQERLFEIAGHSDDAIGLPMSFAAASTSAWLSRRTTRAGHCECRAGRRQWVKSHADRQ